MKGAILIKEYSVPELNLDFFNLLLPPPISQLQFSF